MEGTYSVYFAGQAVGTVWVKREGLYYHFQCDCEMPKKKLCKICVRCGDEQILLGTPIPNGNGFTLRKKIAVKRFGAGQLRFVLYDVADGQETFVPVREDEPFAYIKYLKLARMQVRDGVMGVVLPRNVRNKDDFNCKTAEIE